MNEPTRLSDREVTDMLRWRSARLAPNGLTSAVLDSLASERAHHPVRTASRSAKRPLVLLAAAALLLVGGAVAAGSGVLRLTSTVPPVPSLPTPSLAVVATASNTPRAGRVAYSVTDCPDTGLPSGCPWARLVTKPWLAAADGGDAHVLQGTSLIGWSADGSRLALESTDDHGVVSVLLADPTGTVVATVGVQCTGPSTAPKDEGVGGHVCGDLTDFALSPDGTRVVYPHTDPNVDNSSVLAILDLATGQTTMLTTTRTTNPPAVDVCNTSTKQRACQGFDGSPRWSPDGRTIAFERQAMAPEAGDSWDSDALFVVDADGSNLRRVTPSSVQAIGPAWSPDGTRLAFEASDAVVNAAGTSVLDLRYDVYSINVDGSGLTRLTNNGISALPDWTSGGRLVFIRNATPTNSEHWIMDADGGNLSRLGGSLADLTGAGCTTCVYVAHAPVQGGLPRAYWQPLP